MCPEDHHFVHNSDTLHLQNQTARNLELFIIYSVTPKPDRWDFVNIEKIHNKYQLLMVRFIIVIHDMVKFRGFRIKYEDFLLLKTL